MVCIPTYNERDNIVPLLNEVLSATAADVHALVIDDNSPDGTAEAIRPLMGSRVYLLSRPGKQGLGKAYLAGIAWGLERGYEIIVTMDADFSHRPSDLVKILSQFKDSTFDFAIGSRYIPGGSTVNWGLLRKFISRGGSIYARLVLRFPLRDWTGGFNAYRRRVLEKIHLETIESTGYCFQIEMKFRSLLFGFKHIEVPITFEDRRVGQSKMSGTIFLEALLRVWTLRLQVAASLKNEILQ